MEPCRTLTQRKSAQPLLRDPRVDDAANGNAGRRGSISKPLRTPGPHDSDEVLIVKGLGIGRGAVLCGVLLVVLILLILLLGTPTALATLLYKDSPYVERPSPIPCHSHNDYWREEPLLSALRTGCVGVEADVWLAGGDLCVAHDERGLTPGLTFSSLYVDPLVELLEQRNTFSPARGWTAHGVYESDPAQTLVLLVDLKSGSRDTWPAVLEQLRPLRERGWLTHVGRDGGAAPRVDYRPVTVVGSGSTEFEDLAAGDARGGRRDALFDAPLGGLEGSPYNASNSYYASASFTKHLGVSLTGRLSGAQLERLRRAVGEAHARGLKARYWGSPSWALNVRDRVWRTLSEEGVDLVNVDDLQGFRDWTARRLADGYLR